MKRTFWFINSVVTLSFLLISAQLYCQQKGNNEFKPEVGQEGKDVVWVPTPQALVEKMLDLAQVTPSDIVIDLGSGDGRTVIAAAKRGARAIGVEYNPDMVALSYRNAEKEGLKNKVEFVNGDLFEYDFSKATVLTMFLLPDINLRLRPQILDMRPGTRVVSNTFTMGEWTPDDTATIDDESTHWNTAYLWIVPAKVEGRWKLQPQGELILRQEFQMVTGEMITGGRKEAISEGKIHGDEITFYVGKTLYRGKIRGNSIEGTSENGQGTSARWSATR